MADSTTQPTLYFGYGSNLWQHQMQLRCPTSEYLGIARLDNYRWMINDRGYANVVEMPTPAAEPKDMVYGLVYSLLPTDEAGLDANEGVPWAYTKENLPVSFWPKKKEGAKVDTREQLEKRHMLVYIDRKRIEDDKPKSEYIYRMNMGIKDAVKEGVPVDYIDKVMRKFIPEKEDEGVQKVAMQQALAFEDEV